MKRVVAVLPLVLVFAWLMAAAAAPPRAAAQQPQEANWTYAIYANGDNDLEYTWARFTLPFLLQVPANPDPANPNLNVVVALDRMSTHTTQLIQISGGVERVIATYPGKNFGAPTTFAWFIREVARRFPARHLAVSVWDHGYAWRYFSWDETSSDDITMPEMQSAIRSARVPIDILAFDACNMGSIEVVYQAACTHLVRYIVGSEETIDQDGYPYGSALAAAALDPGRTPQELARDLVLAYHGYYHPLKSFNWVSLGAIDVGRVLQARSHLLAWRNRMVADLAAYRDRYALALRGSIFALESDHVDLEDFLRHLIADPAVRDGRLKALSRVLVTDLRAAVLSIRSGSWARDYTGLTIWWPGQSGWAAERRPYGEVGFAKDIGWWFFLRAFNTRKVSTQVPRPYAPFGLTAIRLTDARHAVATGYGNFSDAAFAVRTADGGRTWTSVENANWGYMLSSVGFGGGGTGWLSGDGGLETDSTVLVTHNGGVSWTAQHSGTMDYLTEIEPVDPTHAFIVGGTGTVLRTTNGGAGSNGWQRLDLGAGVRVWAGRFFGRASGLVVGGDAATGRGMILRTTNADAASPGAVTWTAPATLPACRTLFAVAFPTPNVGWAVGGYPAGGHGVILKTTDGGATWKVQASELAQRLAAVYAASSSAAWAVGDRGTILRTTDGGSHWTPVSSGVRFDLASVWFTNAVNGWAVGDGSLLLHTTDRGVHWTLQHVVGSFGPLSLTRPAFAPAHLPSPLFVRR